MNFPQKRKLSFSTTEARLPAKIRKFQCAVFENMQKSFAKKANFGYNHNVEKVQKTGKIGIYTDDLRFTSDYKPMLVYMQTMSKWRKF